MDKDIDRPPDLIPNYRTIYDPGIRLKILLAKKYWVLNINEHRTSCLNHLTEEQLENVYLKHRNGKHERCVQY